MGVAFETSCRIFRAAQPIGFQLGAHSDDALGLRFAVYIHGFVRRMALLMPSQLNASWPTSACEQGIL